MKQLSRLFISWLCWQTIFFAGYFLWGYLKLNVYLTDLITATFHPNAANPYAMAGQRALLVQISSLALVSTPATIISLILYKKLTELRSGTCRTCSYALRGLTEPRCPECGTPFERKEQVREPEGTS